MSRSMHLSLWILLALFQVANAADFSFTITANGTTSWVVSSPSSPDLVTGGPNNPTINLILGKRYAVTANGALDGHPFAVIAKGPTDATDVILMSEEGAGTLMADSGINWTNDNNRHVQFTVTSTLIAAMSTAGHVPGYRCDVHTSDMRGNFSIFGNGTAVTNPYPNIPKGPYYMQMQNVVTSMTAPLGIVFPNDATGRAFIFEQNGFVRVLQSTGTLRATPFMDISSRLVTLGAFGPGSYDERGLTGFALNPSFASNHKVYTHTSEPVGGAPDFTVPHSAAFNHQEVIAEWSTYTTDTNQINPASRRELIRIDHPQFNHNGGTMAFGKDGFLYIGMGDGGNGDDQGDGHDASTGNAQNTNVILGKILRIDVNGSNSANGKYGIPATNPFASGVGGLKEIFVYGVRNPYSFSFDKNTGQLYLGEVGQNAVEEIDVMTTASAGKNLGWSLKEGPQYFDGRTTTSGSDGIIVNVPLRPLPTNLLEPVAQYDHDDGIAITGGFVYRGPNAVFNGKYFFGDLSPSFTTPLGRLFYLDTGNVIREFNMFDASPNTGLFIKGFGQNLTGEVYLCASKALAPFGTGGRVIKLIPQLGPNAAKDWTVYNK